MVVRRHSIIGILLSPEFDCTVPHRPALEKPFANRDNSLFGGSIIGYFTIYIHLECDTNICSTRIYRISMTNNLYATPLSVVGTSIAISMVCTSIAISMVCTSIALSTFVPALQIAHGSIKIRSHERTLMSQSSRLDSHNARERVCGAGIKQPCQRGFCTSAKA
jgi:hypothetical protein